MPRAVMRRRPRLLRWVLATWLASGCVLDPDDRCGPYQTLWGDDQRCICEDGAAYTPTGCVPCKENEVVTPAGCACLPGFGRANAAELCAPCGEHEVSSVTGCICEAGFSRAALGAPCTDLDLGGAGSACSSDAECMNVTFSRCQLRSNGTGYCTNQGCTTNADCAQGFSCIGSSSPSTCRLPPDGAGRPCATPQDCADSEALFCDTLVSQTCLVQDCSLESNDCFPGGECCDVGLGLPPLCIAAGACQT